MAARTLFCKYNVFGIQQRQQDQAKQNVQDLPTERLTDDDETLTNEVLNSVAMQVPELDKSGIYQSDREVQIDARRLPNRLVLNRSRPVLINGTEITIQIPFKGQSFFFDVRTSTFTTVFPLAEIDD